MTPQAELNVLKEFKKKEIATVKLVDQQQFEDQIEQVKQSIEENKDVNQIKKTLIILKNDSIEKRVTQIIGHFENDLNLLLVGRSNSIGKLISILEISKTKIKVVHCNKVVNQKSLLNPNKPSKDINKSEEGQELESIKGPKEYNLPVMYVFLFKGNKDDVAFGTGWTYQEN